MVIKKGRWGAFLACSGYPDCKTTRRIISGTRRARQPDVPLDENCPECGSQLVMKHGRYGEFIGCTGYPKCKFIRAKTLGINCPKCGTGELLERRAKKGRRRVFYGCNRYPECDFTTPHKPIPEPCPKCGAPFIVEKQTKTEHTYAPASRKAAIGRSPRRKASRKKPRRKRYGIGQAVSGAPFVVCSAPFLQINRISSKPRVTPRKSVTFPGK